MEQPRFVYFECPDCGFDSVLHQTTADGTPGYCPICAEDNGRDVRMRRRVADSDDKPEGRDARLVIPSPHPGSGK